MLKIFQRGRENLGDRALSTSIVKLLEEKCNENLRAKGFTSFLEELWTDLLGQNPNQKASPGQKMKSATLTVFMKTEIIVKEWNTNVIKFIFDGNTYLIPLIEGM